ncbi:hypothetical protein KY332_03265 [Candidatus Woesearchaeota archaeon]|nr:hypothetical protein [Candidatus Woesearchaeota archaeon]
MDKHKKILILIFILTLALRLYFAFSTQTLDHEAYYNLRQIESIKTNGLPIFQDNLSYGGRTSLFIPVFQYFLSIFSFILPTTIVLKLIPNLLASTIVIISYLIAKKITSNKNAALFCSFISAFIPIYLIETVNSSSIYSLTIPLTFLALYFLMNLHKIKYITYFLTTSILLTIIHPSSSLLIIGLIIYAVIVNLEGLPQKKQETESILFLTFFSIWINIILYKKAFLQHGPSVIWQNIPPAVLSFYFAQTNVLEAIIKIGFIPVIFGIYAIYRYIFKEKNKNLYLLFGLTLAIFFLTWFKLLQPTVALMVLGVILAILFTQGYKLFFDYLKTTKLAKHKRNFLTLFILIFILTSVIPSIYFTHQRIQASPTQDDIQALEWLKQNTDPEDTIAASLKEGHLINAIAERKNILDTNFLLAPNTAERYEGIKAIYKYPQKTEAISTLNEYNIKYIFFSPTSKSEFDIQELHYLDRKCFKAVYDNQTKIYKSFCKVEEI